LSETDIGDSCCGTDCHLATAIDCHHVLGFVRILGGGLRILVITNTPTFRLERPPRTVGA
jgi:hypothetical protein